MKALDRAGLAGTLLLPLFLLHGRGVAEGLVVLIGLGFLGRSAAVRDWDWLGRFWVRVGLAWWIWLVACSTASLASLAQAAGTGRFLLLLAAMEHWTLRDAGARLWLARLLRLSAVYLAVHSLAQFATGRNLYGFPRGADGELTGPYRNPRAGAPLSRLLFPAVLPLAARWRPVWGLPLVLGGVGVVVLIGQRMPVLLTLLGLFVTALLLPRLRPVVLATCVLAGGLLGATSVISPPTFARLVTKFSNQMEHFPDSHYGQIAARSLAIARSNPLQGAGYDGFRDRCEDPALFQGWHGDDGGGAAICVQHPHNHYLQALLESGVPGLLLFCALVLSWLHAVGRGLWREPDPLRVGLFVAVLLHEWPVASASAFTSMPLSGWFFVLLGLGLAEGRAYMARNSSP